MDIVNASRLDGSALSRFFSAEDNGLKTSLSLAFAVFEMVLLKSAQSLSSFRPLYISFIRSICLSSSSAREIKSLFATAFLADLLDLR